MTDNIISGQFNLAQMDKNTRPENHSPTTALKAALEWIEAGNAYAHVIVFLGTSTDDGGSSTKYFQAGQYRHHAQMGLCHEGMLMMRDNA